MSGLVFAVLFPVFAQSAPQENSSLLQAGINAYQKGNYDEARKQFYALADQNSWKFVALYNLGNVAARQKHFGEAEAYYDLALARHPHDSDTLFNLRFVQEALGPRRFSNKISNYEFFREHVLTRFAFGEFLVVTLILTILFFNQLTKYLKSRKNSEAGAAQVSPFLAIWGILLFGFMALSAVKLLDTYTERAIVVTDKVDLRSGPNEGNASMTEFQEGAELTVLDSQPGWKQVTPVTGGLTGWVPESSLISISGGGPW